MKKILILMFSLVFIITSILYSQIPTGVISDKDRDLCIIDGDMRLQGTYVSDSLAYADGGTKLDTILIRVPTTNLYYTNQPDSITTRLTIFSYFDSSSASVDSFCGKLPGIVGEWAKYVIGTDDGNSMGDSSDSETGWSSLTWYAFNDSLTYGVINVDEIGLDRPLEEILVRYRKTVADTGTIKYSSYVDLYVKIEGIKAFNGVYNRPHKVTR